MGVPQQGERVSAAHGQALAFGRVRMIDAATETLDYAAFHFDPWDQPFFATGPRMTLELRHLLPPGGAVTYRTTLNPALDKDGSFFWILDAGDYALLGNPRLTGSPDFTPNETVLLARFSVPADGTAYLGTLMIGIHFGLEQALPAWKKDEAAYDIQRVHVVDDGDAARLRLRERFPAVPEPVQTGLMRTD